MNIKLRNASTRMLKGSNGGWTSDPAKALQFECTADAAEAAIECGIDDIEVVVHCEIPPYELVLNPAFCTKPHRKPLAARA